MQRLLMNDREMRTLHEVLDHCLPVASPDLGLAVMEAHVGRAERRQLFDQTRDRPERCRIGGDGDVHEAVVVDGEGPRRKPAVGHRLGHGERGDPQLAIRGVRPPVVRARERPGRAGAIRDRHATVTADVRQCSQLAVVASHEQNRFVEDRDGEEVAGRGELVGSTDAVPRRTQDGLDLEFEARRIGVGPTRQRPRHHGALSRCGGTRGRGWRSTGRASAW